MGHPPDSVSLAYDALGRMVEQNRSGTYEEIAYAPDGAKLALMSGSTLQRGFVPLTGGSVAVYNSSGLAYYRHSDWIGSSRFASTPSRTLYFDGAYGPFGESYSQTGTTDLSFTGMNQDTASTLYDFPAREYGTQGRWPSPDPAGLSSVQITDPQTWNRYAYVRNNPLALIDRTGMDPCEGDGDPTPDPNGPQDAWIGHGAAAAAAAAADPAAVKEESAAVVETVAELAAVAAVAELAARAVVIPVPRPTARRRFAWALARPE